MEWKKLTMFANFGYANISRCVAREKVMRLQRRINCNICIVRPICIVYNGTILRSISVDTTDFENNSSGNICKCAFPKSKSRPHKMKTTQ